MKGIIFLPNSYLVRIHKTFSTVKISTFTIERRMQEYWKDQRELKGTYAFFQLFSRVSFEVGEVKNCSINHGETFFIGNKTYLMCPGRFCIFPTAL